jgi:exoribonuclease R
MFSTTLRRAGLAGLATATLAAVLATAAASNASADRADRAAGAAGADPWKESTAAARPNVERQHGIVLECTGDGVHVTVYENAIHGNSATAVLGDLEEGHFGYTEQTTAYLVDGQLSVAVDVEGVPVSVTGSAVLDGQPTRIVEPQQDAGEQIVTRGTNTPLATDLVADVAGDVVPLECSPAFAYDLEVRKVTLYGN